MAVAVALGQITFFCGLGHAFELREVDVWSRYAYPEDLSMAEAAATEMALSWEAHVVNLKEAPVLRIAVLSVMGNLHNWSGNYSEISKQTSPPVVSFGNVPWVEAEALLLQCAPVVADLNSVKASVGMTMLAACQMAARDGVRVVLSGLGLGVTLIPPLKMSNKQGCK